MNFLSFFAYTVIFSSIPLFVLNITFFDHPYHAPICTIGSPLIVFVFAYIACHIETEDLRKAKSELEEQDAVGDFLAETHKQLSFHAPNQYFSEACGKVKQYVSPEQSRLVDRVMRQILSKSPAEELRQTVPPVLDEFLSLNSVCSEHRKMFSASVR